MNVEDDARASEYLQRIGYYRLSAYWHPMRRRTGSIVDDGFVNGTTFKEVTDLYTFDGRLRLITLDALERLEVSLRTEIALTVGAHGPWSYRELATFGPFFKRAQKRNGPTRHREWLERFDRAFNRSRDRFAEHFRSKYPGDHMPIWIAVELLDFGPLSRLIAGLSYRDRRVIGSHYGGVSPDHIATWSQAMSVTRNVCAHHARLWNKPLVNQPSLTGADVPEPLKHVLEAPGGVSRYYAIACVLRYMLSFANPRTKWRDRFVEHIESFPNSPRLSLTAAGFPVDWQDEDLWRERT